MDLLAAWERLCARAGLKPAPALGARLVDRYSEPHRAYHNLDHLAQVIGLLEDMRADTRLLLAGWFHDAVYEPGSPGNERRSAELALRSLVDGGYPSAAARFVADAVLATASHATVTEELAPLLDADLAILGAPPRIYDRYRVAIRREYCAVPANAFLAGRAGFVRSMLARPTIFCTDYGRRRFEICARSNLQRELGQLEQTIPEIVPCVFDPPHRH